MLADELDYVVGVDTHGDLHTLGVIVAAPAWWRGGAIGAGERTRPGYADALGFAKKHAAGERASGRLKAPVITEPAWLATWSSRGETVIESGSRLVTTNVGCAARTTRSTRSAPHAQHSRARRSALPRSGQRREALRLLLLARRSAIEVRRGGVRAAAERDRDRPRSAPGRAAGAVRTGGCSSAAACFRRSRLRSPSTKKLDDEARPAHTRPTNRRGNRGGRAKRSARSSATSARSHHNLLEEAGVGPIVAADVIVAWSHHGRVRTEAAFARLAGVAPVPASSGQTVRHRLSRGGDRQLNRALHTIALHRRLHDPATQLYVEATRRRRQEPPRSNARQLKRYQPRPPPLPTPATTRGR